jgi:hypothetical protein
MNAVNLLSNTLPASTLPTIAPPIDNALPLADIHLPNSVSAWPPAIGWWLLVLLVIIFVIGIVLVIKKYRQKWGYRKAALALLKQQYQSHLATEHTPQESQQKTVALGLLRILKRTAISAYPNLPISALHGQAWLDFLDQQTPKILFTESTIAQWILTKQYQSSANTDIDLSQLYHACQYWIKKHRTHISETPVLNANTKREAAHSHV